MDIITSAPSSHIGIGNRLGYSVGNLGKSVVLTVLDAFLLYYLVITSFVSRASLRFRPVDC